MTLTAREHQVCDLIVLGHSDKLVARQLGIGLRTVEGYRSSIYRKMEVSGIWQLMRKVVRNNPEKPCPCCGRVEVSQ